MLIITGFVMLRNENQQYYPSRGEELINEILNNSAEAIYKKYDTKPCGVGLAMPGGPIRKATLCFNTRYPYNKTELRKFLVEFSSDLLHGIRQNDEIQEFLARRPFTINNVEIIIYNNGKDGREIYDPQISVARISSGILIYRTKDIDDKYKLNNEYRESYEEALKLLNESE